MRKSKQYEMSPAFQFYARDWISDPNRMMLSLEDQGAYILLYCHCWRSGVISSNKEVLARMCNCSLDKIEKIFPRIKHLFRVNKDGTLTCLHAEEERAEQKANRDKRIAAGKKGAEKRWDASAKKK